MGEWVKCSDRLPEDSEDVTMYIPGTGVMNGYFWPRSGDWFYANGDCEEKVYEEVTHWHPLPEPPHCDN